MSERVHEISSQRRAAFQELLHRAVTEGRVPIEGNGLGPHTQAAIETVARQHPDATADLIAIAYDAFAREQG